MLAIIRTTDNLVRDIKREEIFKFEVEIDPLGYLKVFEYDRGVKELVLTTPGSCKINVVK